MTFEKTADMQNTFHNYAKVVEVRAERELERVLFWFQNFAIVPVGFLSALSSRRSTARCSSSRARLVNKISVRIDTKVIRGNEAGFSLVEMIVVLVIIGIISTFAFMQRGSANEQFKRQNVARELKVAFERARFRFSQTAC